MIKNSLLTAYMLLLPPPYWLFAGELTIIPVSINSVQKKGEFTVNKQTKNL